MSLWRLDPWNAGNQALLLDREAYQIINSAAFSVYTGKTLFGDTAPLTIKRDPSNEDLEGQTYVFRGGLIHNTSDPVIRQLWLDTGLTVETVIP